MPAEPAEIHEPVDGTIERELTINAAPSTVYRHLVDPVRMRRWLGEDAELVASPGGVFRVTIAAGVVARGEFVTVQENRRVVFTWGWEGDWNPLAPGQTTVQIDLEPDGDGTILRLRHHGLPAGQVAFHAWGWRMFLPRLETTSAGGDPGPNPLQQVGEAN